MKYSWIMQVNYIHLPVRVMRMIQTSSFTCGQTTALQVSLILPNLISDQNIFLKCVFSRGNFFSTETICPLSRCQ